MVSQTNSTPLLKSAGNDYWREPVNGIDNTVRQSLLKGQTDLPSLVGPHAFSLLQKAPRDHTHNSPTCSKQAKPVTKKIARAHIAKASLLFSGASGSSKQPVVYSMGSSKNSSHNSRNNLNAVAAEGLNVYKSSIWYKRAIEKGFKNKVALDRFNEMVVSKVDEIDPSFYPVCEYCGHSDITLCECLVTGANNTVEIVDDDALVIPKGANSTSWHFKWVDGITRMFVRPRFDIDSPINHQIGWMSNSFLDENALLWAELLAYIRQKQATSYDVNGVADRAACLAHSKKIAKLFMDEMKIPLRERLTANFTNRVHFTIQRAVDQRDDEFLFKKTEQEHNITSYFQRVPWRTLGKGTLLVAFVASPTLCLKVATVFLNMSLYIWRRFAQTNALILARGSTLGFKYLTLHALSTMRAFAGDIWSGLLKPSYTEILRLLCSIASTTSTTVLNFATSRQLLPLTT